MDSFWENSWANADSSRIKKYIAQKNMGEDDLIKMLRQHNVRTVCDAGCGCGIHTAKLAANGFCVSAFDVSAHAIAFTQSLLSQFHLKANLKIASILKTAYKDEQFDGVISIDVLDHIRKAESIKAIMELLRITKPGGIILFTLDSLDKEYLLEPHIVNPDGDYIYTGGKWNGMVFHPYDQQNVLDIVPSPNSIEVAHKNGELIILLKKKQLFK